MGTGLAQRMRWTDVEIVNAVSGRPRVELYGAVAAWADRQGLHSVDVSLSHTNQFALAHAVAVLAPDAAEPAFDAPS